jgi:hypothetical protein
MINDSTEDNSFLKEFFQFYLPEPLTTDFKKEYPCVPPPPKKKL